LLTARPARRAGQRPWCDTGPIRGAALAAVLGVSAGHIRVRDRPE
jgi:hypothetical protein